MKEIEYYMMPPKIKEYKPGDAYINEITYDHKKITKENGKVISEEIETVIFDLRL